jgi:ring-1,2-phenylacetyl-CoA epoxidase subunit PaaC
VSGTDVDHLLTYVLRQGDRSLVLAQRLLEYQTRAPELEEEMALGNVALDLLGQARVLYTYAGEVEGLGHGEDHFAYWRDHTEFVSPLLVEQPNTDFAFVIVRQFLHDAFAVPYWSALRASTDATLAALGARAAKESAYHLRHSRGWVVRLGDGTDESRARTQRAVDALWRCTDELFERDAVEDALVASGVAPDPAALRAAWDATVDGALAEATLVRPDGVPAATGGRHGRHTEAMSYLVGELQVVARAHPGASW